MANVSLKGGKAETALAKALWAEGVRYRKNYRKLPGSPDIAITKYNIAVFVDGEFWHGFDWENRKTKLKSNRDYWIEKIEENMARDIRNDKLLQEQGWITLPFPCPFRRIILSPPISFCGPCSRTAKAPPFAIPISPFNIPAPMKNLKISSRKIMPRMW